MAARQGQAVWGATALHQRRVDWGAAATRGLIPLQEWMLQLTQWPVHSPFIQQLGRVHTCSGHEPDSSVPGARVRFASTRAKNRPAANRSRPVKLKPRVYTATGTVRGRSIFSSCGRKPDSSAQYARVRFATGTGVDPALVMYNLYNIFICTRPI